MSGLSDNISELLTAFSDGELDAADNQRMLRHLQEHPEALVTLETEQQLRIAARRAVVEGTPKASSDLRSKIAMMTVSDAEQPPVLAKIGPTGIASRRVTSPIKSLILACAASVVIGVTIGYVAKPELQPERASVLPVPPVTLVSATTLSAVTRLHVDCSRMLTMHIGGYPKELNGLADVVKQELNHDQPYPDLSKVGYAFVGAGPCYHPLESTVHLLYRSKRSWINDTLSIFVQPYTGQLQIDAGKAYSVAGDDAAHPVVVWRTDKVIYFVVGDNREVVDKVCTTIGLAKL